MAGNIAPLRIKNKDKWINNERLRWAKYFNVPIVNTVPDGFPANTVQVMRTICAVSHLANTDQPAPSPSSPPAQQAIIKALDAVFDAYWVKKRDITDKDVIADVLSRAGWEDLAKVSELTAGDAKRMLAENTDGAFADGAFGLPWFVCENDRGEKEGFWGVDHLGVMLDFLGLEKPAAGGEWRAML
ncbi:hypothetical protein J7T55_000094 [Diaporthe amygdali]|uniref:uncharacterized protein n=1 Tax=Phomopsis amygdali TaxID=1214568 RepID=UPI0022FF24D3|nr:uncharacterized protein J7T55_000094 [Diaporthe amygdali]KAJ0107831.1 hypothetical protein J7T55_000094 [Diaporthe amygdali]